MTTNPYIAVTMGDAAGIGPEVVVRALLDPEVAGTTSCVVIGDAARLRAAAALVGLTPDIVTVDPWRVPSSCPAGSTSSTSG